MLLQPNNLSQELLGTESHRQGRATMPSVRKLATTLLGPHITQHPLQGRAMASSILRAAAPLRTPTAPQPRDGIWETLITSTDSPTLQPFFRPPSYFHAAWPHDHRFGAGYRALRQLAGCHFPTGSMLSLLARNRKAGDRYHIVALAYAASSSGCCGHW